MSEDRRLLWLDLETTGSDEDRDEIIEVGCLMTDSQLNIIDEFPEYSRTVTPSKDALLRLLETKVVRDMHTANGLLTEVLDQKSIDHSPRSVEQDLMSRLAAIQPKFRQVMIAGSGVGHFDRRFINKYWPDIDRYLHYAPFDIGNIRRAFKAWDIPIPTSAEGKNHRALDDAKLHLEEARAYKAMFEGHLKYESPTEIIDDDGITIPSKL